MIQPPDPWINPGYAPGTAGMLEKFNMGEKKGMLLHTKANLHSQIQTSMRGYTKENRLTGE